MQDLASPQAQLQKRVFEVPVGYTYARLCKAAWRLLCESCNGQVVRQCILNRNP